MRAQVRGQNDEELDRGDVRIVEMSVAARTCPV
jgi:hypothetical protein